MPLPRWWLTCRMSLKKMKCMMCINFQTCVTHQTSGSNTKLTKFSQTFGILNISIGEIYINHCLARQTLVLLPVTHSWYSHLIIQLGCVNSLRPRQNGCHFTDDVFKWFFVRENVWISLKISLKFGPKASINNIPAFVQIMAWRWPGHSHYLNQWWLVYWRILVSLGRNELNS